MATEKIEMLLLRLEDEAVNHIDTTVRQTSFTPQALSEVRATSALIDRLYLLDRRGRLLFPSPATEEDERVVSRLLAEISPSLWERGGRRRVLLGEEVFLTAVLRTAEDAPLLTALSRNPEVLRRDVLAETLGTLEAPTVVAVIDDRDRVVYSRQNVNPADPIVTVRFGEVLPSWRVALYQQPGLSPRHAVRRQVTVFSVVFGLLLVVIVAGLAATYRLVRRETEMARLKADFVANVSHDLKTPLALIRLFGETLEMGRVPDEPARREYYRVITRESERLSRLIDNVLDFSRVEEGRRPYDMTPTAVEPVIRETLEAFTYVLTKQNFHVEVAVARDLPDVSMDAAAVSQALSNLVDNAIKYSGNTKTLRIDARIDGDALCISVADEGVGIPPEEQPKIFEKFYRVGWSETQGRRGSGVGLALVRHVAGAHGGDVTVQSQPGQGSRFTLRLPLKPKTE